MAGAVFSLLSCENLLLFFLTDGQEVGSVARAVVAVVDVVWFDLRYFQLHQDDSCYCLFHLILS